MISDSFSYEALPGRVVFGQGTLSHVAQEAERLGGSRAIVVCGAEQADLGQAVFDGLAARGAALFPGAVMHTPVDVSDTATRIAQDAGSDLIVSVGGGSATGLGKAIALRTGLPLLAIPTTYAGSEATPILGQSENGLKTTQRDLKVQPKTVLYDVDLTIGMPLDLSVTSGVNAMAHAVEALYAKDGNPITSLMAESGIAALASALPRIRRDGADLQARTDALYGAWLCGVCLGTVGMSLHHKLCHTLGGSFGLPHAPTHCVVLPHALAYNAAAAPDAMIRIARALGAPSAAGGLFDLLVELEAPTSLRGIGMLEADLDRAAELAVQSPYWNPRPVKVTGIRKLLANAFAGVRPE